MSVDEQILAAAQRIRELGESAPRPGRDPVNQPMINNWTEALGDDNPLYRDAATAQRIAGGPVAPPAMAQVWSMNGLRGSRTADDPLGLMTAALDEAGYTSVVATNSDQTYYRHLHVGEEVTASSRLEDVVGPKHTALGEGWFFTTRTLWRVGDEVVGDMIFRILKFKPDAADSPEQSSEQQDSGPSGRIVDASGYAGGVLRPVISRDTEFYWDGAQRGELRIQRFNGVLRHPPGPMDPGGDLSAVPDYVVSPGTGTVFSFVVHQHPKVPGKRLPFVVALVELDEGVRVLGELIDVDPSEVRIGMAVRAVFLRVDEELTLPAWEVA